MSRVHENRHGDTLTFHTRPECGQFVLHCASRRGGAKALVDHLGSERTSARIDVEPVEIDFYCEGPERFGLIGPLALQLCRGDDVLEVAVQIRNKRDHPAGSTA